MQPEDPLDQEPRRSSRTRLLAGLVVAVLVAALIGAALISGIGAGSSGRGGNGAAREHTQGAAATSGAGAGRASAESTVPASPSAAATSRGDPVASARENQEQIRDRLAIEVRAVPGVEVGAYGTEAGMRAYAKLAAASSGDAGENTADVSVDNDRQANRGGPGICWQSMGLSNDCTVTSLAPDVEQTLLSGASGQQRWVTATLRRSDGVTISVSASIRSAVAGAPTMLTKARAAAVAVDVARLVGVLGAPAGG